MYNMSTILRFYSWIEEGFFVSSYTNILLIGVFLEDGVFLPKKHLTRRLGFDMLADGRVDNTQNMDDKQHIMPRYPFFRVYYS